MRHPILPIASLAALALGACGDSSDGKTLVTESGDRLDWTRTAALVAATSCDDAHVALKAAAITQMELQLEQSRRCYLQSEGCYRGGLENAPGTDDGATPRTTTRRPTSTRRPTRRSRASTKPTS